MDWTLTQIRSKFRELTGILDTGDESNADVDLLINDYYLNTFPLQVKPQRLKTWFTQATSATDDGEYSVSSDVKLLLAPAMIDGTQIVLHQNASKFFVDYPKDTGHAYCVTDPSLAIGSSSEAAVANSAFSYRIGYWSYSKAAAETALSGDAVPVNKHGAWKLSIDSDGTITVTEADGNSTGYDTPAAAVDALDAETADEAPMGYVTVINTSGSFTPGTTLLSAAGVTATYTDHFHSTRNRPQDALLHGGKLYLRPKPDDIYQFKCVEIEKPTELSGDSDTCDEPEWGRLVAYGTAIEYKLANGDTEGANELQVVFNYYHNLIKSGDITQKQHNQRATPKF